MFLFKFGKLIINIYEKLIWVRLFNFSNLKIGFPVKIQGIQLILGK